MVKLVSINGILIASSTFSIFFKLYSEGYKRRQSNVNQQQYFPVPPILIILTLIFLALLLLLEYEHRQFKYRQIQIEQSTALFRRYLNLFAAGTILTFVIKTLGFQGCSSLLGSDRSQQIIQNILLGKNNIEYSMLYYTCNFVFGHSYLYLFKKAYQAANKSGLAFYLASNCSQKQTDANQIYQEIEVQSSQGMRNQAKNDQKIKFCKCTICLGIIKNGQKVAKVGCIHKFHWKCMNKWVKYKQCCPCCLKAIDVDLNVQEK